MPRGLGSDGIHVRGELDLTGVEVATANGLGRSSGIRGGVGEFEDDCRTSRR